MMTENKTDNILKDINKTSTSCSDFKYILIRISFVGVLIGCVILNTIYGFLLPQSNIDCVLDYTFIWTHNINGFFNKNKLDKYLLLIISSLLIDIILLSSASLWIAYGKSWRYVLALLLFYSSDVIMQIIFQIRTPDGYIIEYPGIPSISVSYMNTMFFPGQIGFLAIASLESRKINNNYMFTTCVATLVLQILTRNFLRGSYVIDIFTALVIAHYLFIFADAVCTNYFDNVDNEWFKLSNNTIRDMECCYFEVKLDENEENKKSSMDESFCKRNDEE